MELRLIEALREQDVKPRTIRRAIIEASGLFKNQKPFATDKIVLRTDGRSVFVEEILKKAAKDENDRKLWNLVTKQYEHYELMERTLANGVTFDPATHLAKLWVPRPISFPDIRIDPRIAYGRPITRSNVPTDAIYDAWKAENDNYPAVADWFQIPTEEIEMAVRFQEELMRPPEALAA